MKYRTMTAAALVFLTGLAVCVPASAATGITEPPEMRRELEGEARQTGNRLTDPVAREHAADRLNGAPTRPPAPLSNEGAPDARRPLPLNPLPSQSGKAL